MIPGENPNSKQPEGGRVLKHNRLVGRVRHSVLTSLLVEPQFYQEAGGKTWCSICCPLLREEETKEQRRAAAYGVAKEWEKIKLNE